MRKLARSADARITRRRNRVRTTAGRPTRAVQAVERLTEGRCMETNSE